MLNTQKPCHGDIPADYTRNRERQYAKLSTATLNVGTMRGRSAEIAEMVFCRYVNICCMQETRCKVKSARKIMGKNSL